MVKKKTEKLSHNTIYILLCKKVKTLGLYFKPRPRAEAYWGCHLRWETTAPTQGNSGLHSQRVPRIVGGAGSL